MTSSLIGSMRPLMANRRDRAGERAPTCGFATPSHIWRGFRTQPHGIALPRACTHKELQGPLVTLHRIAR
jgi:hypothetical protein